MCYYIDIQSFTISADKDIDLSGCAHAFREELTLFCHTNGLVRGSEESANDISCVGSGSVEPIQGELKGLQRTTDELKR